MIKLNLYMISIFFISLITAILICFLPSLPSAYSVIALLPIAYSILMLISTKFHILARRYLGIKIVYAVMFLRYVIMPLLMALSGSTVTVGRVPSDRYILPSVMIMIWELVASVFTIVIVGNHILLKENKKPKIYLNDKGKSNLVYVILIIICILLIIVHPTLIENFQFFNVTEEGTKSISFIKGLDIRLLLILKVIIYSLLISKFSDLYKEKKSYTYYYLALLTSILYIGMIRGDNRTNIVVDIICVVTVMWHSFPHDRKKSIVMITSMGLILVLSVSLYRSFAVTSWRPQGNEIEFNLSFFSNFFQSYISGPSNVAFAIETADIFNNVINFKTFLNDFFAWTGYLGNYLGISSSDNLTSYLFNIDIYSLSAWGGYGDQIIPMSGQGYIYFGYLGAPIFSVIICIWIVYLDKVRTKARSLDKLIIDTYLVSRLALFMGLNITIMMMFIFDKYLQLWIVEKANSVFKIKRARDKNVRDSDIQLKEERTLI